MQRNFCITHSQQQGEGQSQQGLTHEKVHQTTSRRDGIDIKQQLTEEQIDVVLPNRGAIC
jgi:hypothetical protein